MDVMLLVHPLSSDTVGSDTACGLSALRRKTNKQSYLVTTPFSSDTVFFHDGLPSDTVGFFKPTYQVSLDHVSLEKPYLHKQLAYLTHVTQFAFQVTQLAYQGTVGFFKPTCQAHQLCH